MRVQGSWVALCGTGTREGRSRANAAVSSARQVPSSTVFWSFVAMGCAPGRTLEHMSSGSPNCLHGVTSRTPGDQ